jgi:hypothetical protein
MLLEQLLKEVNQNKYTIYQDMDGCIVDFDSRYEHFTGRSPQEMDAYLMKQYGKEKAKEMFWEPVNELGPEFWAEMEWMPDGKYLWNYIKKYNPVVLSAPSRSKTSSQGKKMWMQKHLPGVELILKQAHEKHEYACPECIIIDDRKSTIDQWNSSGGIAIFHSNAQTTIEELKKLGL